MGDLTHSNDFNHQLHTDAFQILAFLLSSGALWTTANKTLWMASRDLPLQTHKSKLVFFLVHPFLPL